MQGRSPVRQPVHSGSGRRAAPPETRLRRLVSFGVVGVAATAITLVLYAVLRTWWPPVAANLVAVSVSTLFNTEANRRSTFRSRSRARPLAVLHVQSFVVFGLYCGFTSGALLLLQAVAGRQPRWVELAVLVVASAMGTVGRYVLLSTWVFRQEADMTVRTRSDEREEALP